MASGGARRLHELVNALLRWPWWAGVAVAALAWAALSGVAAALRPAPGPALLRGSVLLLQWLLPLLCLAASALGAWLRYRRRKNYRDVASEQGHAALERLSWREFEAVVAEFFRRKGFTVEDRGGGEDDGGVDLVAGIGEDRYLVQCKHWRVQRVGVKVVRALCAVAAAEGAAGVFVVTSGSFTDEARRYVEDNRFDIELITGDRLRSMIQGLEASRRTAAAAPDAAPAALPPDGD